MEQPTLQPSRIRRIVGYLNTPIGSTILSALLLPAVLSVVAFCYGIWERGNDNENTILRIETEVCTRLNAFTDLDKRSTWMAQEEPEIATKAIALFHGTAGATSQEFTGRSLVSLLIELASRVPSSERNEIDEAARECFNLHSQSMAGVAPFQNGSPKEQLAALRVTMRKLTSLTRWRTLAVCMGSGTKAPALIYVMPKPLFEGSRIPSHVTAFPN